MSLVHGIDTMDSYDDSTNIVAWMDRPFKCTCCCLARPELTVYWGTLDNTSNVIGKVLEPCTCIEIQMDLVDNASNSRFNIVADGCQCGICCRGSPCGRCSEVVFPIYKSSTQVKELGNCSGNIKRLFPGCLKSVATDAAWRLQTLLNVRRFVTTPEIFRMYKAQVLSYVESWNDGAVSRGAVLSRIDRVQRRFP